MKREEQRNQLLMVTLAVGFFIGIIYENIMSKRSGISVRIFQTEQLVLYQNMAIKGYSYLFYVIKQRALPLIVVAFLWNFRWRKLFVIFAFGWCGMVLGRIIVSAMIVQGMKGILICLAALFPQSVFYALAYMILFFYLYSDKRRWWNKTKTGVVVVLFLLGILTEVYINPMILKMVIDLV